MRRQVVESRQVLPPAAFPVLPLTHAGGAGSWCLVPARGLIATGNDLTGWTVSDPCGCTATCQDEIGVTWRLGVCDEHRQCGVRRVMAAAQRAANNAAKRDARRKRKAARKRNRR